MSHILSICQPKATDGNTQCRLQAVREIVLLSVLISVVDSVETVSQQFVRIECPGYAVVEFNCYTSYCMLQFGSGCLMSVTPSGGYTIINQ